MANEKQYLYRKQDGSLPFLMTNDYMFRALLQENPAVLKALLASLLHMEESERWKRVLFEIYDVKSVFSYAVQRRSETQYSRA